jgi:hypothetical protein
MSDILKMTLAQRREALVAQCELQRYDARAALGGLLAPVHKPAGMLAAVRERFGGNLAMPLAVAGAVIGLLVVRRKQAIPLLTGALGAWKLVSSVLDTVRQARSASQRTDESPV